MELALCFEDVAKNIFGNADGTMTRCALSAVTSARVHHTPSFRAFFFSSVLSLGDPNLSTIINCNLSPLFFAFFFHLFFSTRTPLRCRSPHFSHPHRLHPFLLPPQLRTLSLAPKQK